LRKEVLGRARQIAAAAGGVLGCGSISRAEAAVLEEVETALTPQSLSAVSR
jgi:hypothetical protein